MTTPILALDPGPERSALVYLNNDFVVWQFLEPNPAIRERLIGFTVLDAVLVVEEVASYGMPVGREIFQTVFWAGRFCEVWDGAFRLVPRRAVKLALCHSAKANDAAIRQALLDRYGPGREKAIGTKRNPGPLYGIRRDMWAALALGVAYADSLVPDREAVS